MNILQYRKGFLHLAPLLMLLLIFIPAISHAEDADWRDIPSDFSFMKPANAEDYTQSARGSYIGLGLSSPHGLRFDIAGEVFPYINIVGHFSWLGSDFQGGSVFALLDDAASGIPIGNLYQNKQTDSPYWGANSKLFLSQWSAGLLLEVVSDVGLYTRAGLLWMQNDSHWIYIDVQGAKKAIKPVFASIIPFQGNVDCRTKGEGDVGCLLKSHLIPYLGLGWRTSLGPIAIGLEGGIILTENVLQFANPQNNPILFEQCNIVNSSLADCTGLTETKLLNNGLNREIANTIQFLPSIAVTIAYKF